MATRNSVDTTLAGQSGTGAFSGTDSPTFTTRATVPTTPTAATDAASKSYVDAVATGLEIQASCVAAGTAALTVTYDNGASGVGATLTNAGAQATFSIDGVSATASQRVLIKNQASTFQNGIYTVTDVGSGSTNWVLTRATDYDTASEMQAGDWVVIDAGGTENGNTSWLQTATVATVGTDAVTWIQFTASLPISLANGGTSASLTADNGGIFYSNATTGAILASTATGGQMLQSGASTTPTWSTTTWPATLTADKLLYSVGTNSVSELAATPFAVLVSNGGGGPVWVAYTGSGAPVLANTPTLVTPILGAATATSLAFSPTTGGIIGTTTNDNAGAGKVGEFISSNIVSGSAVSLTNNTAADMTSISLTAGDWDVVGNCSFTVGGLCTAVIGWISATSATVPDPSLYSQVAATTAELSNTGVDAPVVRFSLSGTTTIYISALSAFTTSTVTVCGNIQARRVR